MFGGVDPFASRKKREEEKGEEKPDTKGVKPEPSGGKPAKKAGNNYRLLTEYCKICPVETFE